MPKVKWVPPEKIKLEDIKGIVFNRENGEIRYALSSDVLKEGEEYRAKGEFLDLPKICADYTGSISDAIHIAAFIAAFTGKAIRRIDSQYGKVTFFAYETPPDMTGQHKDLAKK